MEPGESLARSTRLAQVQHLLHTPQGLTTAEMAGMPVATATVHHP